MGRETGAHGTTRSRETGGGFLVELQKSKNDGFHLTQPHIATTLLRMNLDSTLKQLSETLGTPKKRASFGQWTTLAWLVRGLVDRGHGISDAVRHVLENTGYASDKANFGGLRAAYYKIKNAEWPVAAEEEPEVEGFE